MPICSEAQRDAFLELLIWTLLQIRNKSDNARLCFALADRMHNVPALLQHFHPDLLASCREVARPCFLRALDALQRLPQNPFESRWEFIEQEYRRQCETPMT